jgi:hypothetical protein
MKSPAQTDVLAFIQACSIEGNTLILPSREAFELDTKQYGKFKKLIESIGGTYVVGKNAFEFEFPPERLIEGLLRGDNYAKALQFYPTPERIAKLMQELVIPRLGWNTRWLEPSAGRGSLIKVILDENPHLTTQIDACEIDDINREILLGMGVNLVGDDFLSLHTSPAQKYDGIVMNPPFSNNQYIKHILHAYDSLKPGGSLSFIAPTSWLDPRSQLERDFNDLITAHAFETHTMPHAFRESGVSIETCIVGLRRPEYDYCYTYLAGTDQNSPKPDKSEKTMSIALNEIDEYFQVIDKRAIPDLAVKDVQLAAANLGYISSQSFCQPLLNHLQEIYQERLAKQERDEPESDTPSYDFGL